MLPFLFVEPKITPIPAGNARTVPFLTSALGYVAASYSAMDTADLEALPDFRVALSDFSAIVVASDHGGMLGADELSLLNGQASAIVSYRKRGRGLYAAAETKAADQIGAALRFDFLRILLVSANFNIAESGDTATVFGVSWTDRSGGVVVEPQTSVLMAFGLLGRWSGAAQERRDMVD